MRMWVSGTARAAMLTASFVALGAGTALGAGSALADVTNGSGSVLGGNQINAPISAPINISGNAVAAGGHARAGSVGGASVHNGANGAGQFTSGKNSILGGNQVNAPVSAPINACGNAIAILGSSGAACKGGATVANHGGSGQRTSGAGSVLGGNQVNAPVSAPINVCGNAIAILGTAEAGCEGGATVANHGSGGQHTVGGNQVNAPVGAPVDICGNAVALLGDAVASCKGGASVQNADGGYSGGQRTTGAGSVLGGNQVNAPVSAPIDACGNAIGGRLASCKGGSSVTNRGSGDQTTSGAGSVLGGNQVHAPVGAPINVCGNAGALLGDAAALCKGGASVDNGSGSAQHTSGNGSVLGGNQVNAPVTAPVNACGNAVAAAKGKAVAHCEGVIPPVGDGNPRGCGDEGYYSAPAAAPRGVAGGLPGLPGLPELPATTGLVPVGALPVGLGALPVLPALPVSPGALPVQTPIQQAAPAPAALGLPALPKVPTAVTNALPGGLPQVPAGLTNGLTNGLPNGLPKVPAGLTNGLPVPVSEQAAPASLPGLPSLPVVGQLPVAKTVLANAPVSDKLNTPQLGAPNLLGNQAITKTAAVSPLSGMNADTLLALVLGGMFAAASTITSIVRRIRRH